MAIVDLTLKQLDYSFQSSFYFLILLDINVIVLSGTHFNALNIWPVLWVLMACCFSTRASVATLLSI